MKEGREGGKEGEKKEGGREKGGREGKGREGKGRDRRKYICDDTGMCSLSER